MADQHLIGVISDTHIPHRLKVMPNQVYDQLQGCSMILHAGDLEDIDILDPLRQIAPVYAVRGNVHWQSSSGLHDQDLPPAVTLRVGGHVIYMTHGHINFARTMMDKLVHMGTRPTLTDVNQTIIERLSRLKPQDADIVIFGHTHMPCAQWINGVLYYNPGAVCKTVHHHQVSSSMGRILICSNGNVKPEWLPVV
jgi:uncharacterized protein